MKDFEAKDFERLLGVQPPTNKKGSITKTVSLAWMKGKFNDLPQDAASDVIEQYARAYILSLLEGTFFSNKTSGTVHPDILSLLENWDLAGQYSWGSAVLAFLYQELRTASEELGKGGNNLTVSFGGCAIFLQLWFWLRVPVGRSEPSFLSSNKESVISPWLEMNRCKASRLSHIGYTLEIDRVNREQIDWEPYGHITDEAVAHLWRATTTLNYFWINEPHNAHRVKKQFGEDDFKLDLNEKGLTIMKPIARGVQDYSGDKRTGPKAWLKTLKEVPNQRNEWKRDDLKYGEYLAWLQKTSFVDFTYCLSQKLWIRRQ